ncbi:MAG: ATP-dependent Clp protease adaptor ClpS [Chlorobi bacterium]|nr:MAG: ATP-dependent Clp protease adaptor ClpS [Bacteroidota bacterium]KXK35525.1 MAG: ATP-dependent Clp protease adaptor protein ClpS [Chlorobi bacterium OLB6]MBE2266178.1 ATP-dependent Clp protease adaptor ClpS [Flavobacteriales bacterium]MBL1162047.1 ATP-dependent Clp protease adaptor ClpS [Chlorobiota bacterium]MBW7853834.1 ATP-dependent Clp protease adaptor ClpS [Candidatus Kapabacteria bacterium]MCC6330386.1 ATP-dependent Clp protease adaptor ClpS [Ignavibacteria bacterium]
MPYFPTEHTDTLLAEDTVTGLQSHVILYNDDEHTIEEVVVQIVLATGYSFPYAMKLTMAVHTSGKETVFTGTISDCLRVASVLQEIQLQTEIVF